MMGMGCMVDDVKDAAVNDRIGSFVDSVGAVAITLPESISLEDYMAARLLVDLVEEASRA